MAERFSRFPDGSREPIRQPERRTASNGETPESEPPRLRIVQRESDTQEAVDTSRANAIALAEETETLTQESSRQNGTKRVVKVTRDGLYVLGIALTTGAYLGFRTSRPALFGAARALDWIGRKMDSIADKWVDKKFPVLKYIINPFMFVIDKSAKLLNVDKPLVEHLKRNKEARKKAAEKILADYRQSEKANEKKRAADAEKANRRKVIEEKLGTEVYAAIVDDLDAAAAAAPAVAAPAAPAAETAKAA